MGAPQIIMIVLFSISGTVTLLNHGKPKENYNFFMWILASVIELALLFWGGFFG